MHSLLLFCRAINHNKKIILKRANPALCHIFPCFLFFFPSSNSLSRCLSSLPRWLLLLHLPQPLLLVAASFVLTRKLLVLVVILSLLHLSDSIVTLIDWARYCFISPPQSAHYGVNGDCSSYESTTKITFRRAGGRAGRRAGEHRREGEERTVAMVVGSWLKKIKNMLHKAKM